MKSNLAILLTNIDMSSSILGALVQQPLDQIICAAVQAVWTGTPTGTLKIQASNDNVNWADLPSPQTLAGAAGNYLWNLTDIGYRYIQIVYTASSGSGSLSANISLKGV